MLRLRLRHDKPLWQADSLGTLEALIGAGGCRMGVSVQMRSVDLAGAGTLDPQGQAPD